VNDGTWYDMMGYLMVFAKTPNNWFVFVSCFCFMGCLDMRQENTKTIPELVIMGKHD